MADRELIGNCIQLALGGGSVAVWALILARKARGIPPLVPVEQHPVSWPAAAVCMTFLVAFLLPPFLMLAISSWLGPQEIVSLARVQRMCLCQVAQVMTVVGLLAVAGPLKKEDFGCRLANWRRDALVGAIGWLASILAIVLARKCQEIMGWRDPDSEHVMFQILMHSSDKYSLFWIVLSAVVLAPIAEELLYRVLLQGFAQSQMAPGLAIFVSSCVFVAQHAVFDWLPLMALSLILGYVYNRRRSYLAVVVLHALFNGVMLGLATMMRK
jgi:membrane protease YdiL (CAAX protease family)